MKGVFRNNIIHFKEVQSTNLTALSMMKENRRSLPFVITTDFQTSGKGQLSNKWDSENGKNVLMSVAINTDIKIENQFILNVISSLSVLDLLEDLNLENFVLNGDFFIDHLIAWSTKQASDQETIERIINQINLVQKNIFKSNLTKTIY